MRSEWEIAQNAMTLPVLRALFLKRFRDSWILFGHWAVMPCSSGLFLSQLRTDTTRWTIITWNAAWGITSGSSHFAVCVMKKVLPSY